MERWPIRLVVGKSGFFVEIKFRDMKELKNGWSKSVPDWPILGLEVKVGPQALWISGAKAYSFMVVRSTNGKFLAFDVHYLDGERSGTLRFLHDKRMIDLDLSENMKSRIVWKDGVEKSAGLTIVRR